MKRILSAVAVALALAVAMFSHAGPATAQEGKAGLFVSLTTDDTWAAGKAIFFAHQKALKNGHEPVVIWLNVRGVYLADKKRPSHVHGLMAESGKSIQDLLTDFMADGGRVLMCQACSAAAGLKLEDYIDGVEMGSWPVVEALLFDPEMKTLSW